MTETFEGRTVVLKSLVGSYSANLNTPASDKDYKYFVAPSFDDLYTGKMFATASVSDTLDYDVHDIRKLANLLWKSNLNFIGALFHMEYIDDGLFWLHDHADELASMNLPYLYSATMGMHFEKMSTLLKGTGNTQVLIEKYGFDTKQGCHALRCLLVLRRISEGMRVREALWFDGADREALMNVKNGKVSLDQFKNDVEVWRSRNDASIKEWFSKQVANEGLKDLLDNRIKEFIRINL